MSSLLMKIKCPRCLELYIEPRILTKCGHSLCTSCVKILSKFHTTIKCPICDSLNNYNTIIDLPLNFAIIEIIQIISEQEISPKIDFMDFQNTDIDLDLENTNENYFISCCCSRDINSSDDD